MDDLSQLDVAENDRPEGLEAAVRLRWVPGHRGKYAVTDDGRVFSFVRGMPTKLSEVEKRDGYKRVHLAEVGKKYVHRLVLRSFKGPCPEGMQCRHLNGDPSDNRAENLTWGTRSENRKDAERHGTAFVPKAETGGENGNSSLSSEQVAELRRTYQNEDVTQEELAEEYGIDQCTVSAIVIGELHRYSPGPISSPTTPAGEKNGHAKLNADAVKSLRTDPPKTHKEKEQAAERYGVSTATIYDILAGRSWKHVEPSSAK